MINVSKKIAGITAIVTVTSIMLPMTAFAAKSNSGRYYVACDDEAFQVGIINHMYMSGYDVPLIFPVIETDKEYIFSVDGVAEFTANYYPGTGYLVMFEMPENEVSVTYEEQDLDGEELKEPEGEISFVFEENYSTGMFWEYSLSEEGIVEAIEDKYVSDPFDPDEPDDGSGGVHFWKFHTVGAGTVDIKFECKRQDEKIEEYTYRYESDGTKVVLIEQHMPLK